MHLETSPSGQSLRDGDELRGPDYVDIDIDPQWLDFGRDDPLEAHRWINPCAECGATPRLHFQGRNHAVECSCGARGNPGGFPAIAAVNWNKSKASRHPTYQSLPFFHLADLSPAEARAKLVKIREYLEEQKRRCEWRIEARIGTGHRYHQRVRAYLLWSVYALSLVKEQEPRPAGAKTGAAFSRWDVIRDLYDRMRSRAWHA